MLTQAALKKEVRPAVFERGSMIASSPKTFSARACRYRDKTTDIAALVESSSGYVDYYETKILVDEAADQLLDYSCDCPAAHRFSGPCKHAIALGLDYIERPNLYEGHDETKHVATSAPVANFLDRNQRNLPVVSAGPVEPPATLQLKPTLVTSLASGEMFVRFHISGSRGGYVVKNLGDFVDDVRAANVVSYGKKLTAVHDEMAFEPDSWDLVQWLVRAVQNRRSYAAERVYGRYYGGVGARSGASTARELRLSAPELDEFIALHKGRSLDLLIERDYEAGTSRAQAGELRNFLVEEGDPDVQLEVKDTGDGTYELVRSDGGLGFFVSEQHAYALQNDKLLICSPRIFELKDFIQTVYCSSESRLSLSAEDAPRFAATVLPQLQKNLGTTAPAALEALKPVACELIFLLDHVNGLVTLAIIACYGDQKVPLYPARHDSNRDLRRDLVAEASARQLASRYFVPNVAAVVHDAAWTLSSRDTEALARLVFSGLGRMRVAGELHTTPAFDQLISFARPVIHWGATVDSGLIRLSVSADDLPLSELYALLASYRKRKSYHRLRDGSLLDISHLDLSEAAALVDELGISAGQLGTGNVELPSYKAFLLNSILHEEDKDQSFEQWIEDFENINPATYVAPAALAQTLRPYQLRGFQWLSALSDMGFGGILADEMGLGKTVQMISLLLARRGRGRSLVVCPASLVYNWQEEFAKFAPDMDIAVVAGTAQQRFMQRHEMGHEVLITSYDLLRRDIEDYVDETFQCVILDEAQYVKNHQTLAARAVKTLKARHRFALTGTPVENRLSELWSIFDFLMPGLLGSYERFRERYEQPIVAGDAEIAARLKAAVGPFILRRLKREVLLDLPDKLETPIFARMEDEQSKLYHAHEQALRLSLEKQSDAGWNKKKMQVLTELMRLRQLCCDPRLVYDDYRGDSCKIDMIWDLISTSIDAGAKLLVFSQFTSFLSLIADKLDKEQVSFFELTGSTPKDERIRLVGEFNRDDTPVFLISLRAGGTGLNLVGAQVVIHADPWWNVAAEDQATDRAHRIGQRSDVTVYKVICKGTIEERIVALQAKKADLADAIVGTGGGMGLASLAREDLIDLLG